MLDFEKRDSVPYTPEYPCESPCKIWWKSIKRLQSYRDLTVFQMAAAAILDLQKFKFLTADTL